MSKTRFLAIFVKNVLFQNPSRSPVPAAGKVSLSSFSTLPHWKSKNNIWQTSTLKSGLYFFFKYQLRYERFLIGLLSHCRLVVSEGPGLLLGEQTTSIVAHMSWDPTLAGKRGRKGTREEIILTYRNFQAERHVAFLAKISSSSLCCEPENIYIKRSLRSYCCRRSCSRGEISAAPYFQITSPQLISPPDINVHSRGWESHVTDDQPGCAERGD